MRIRILTSAIVGLGLAACVGLEQQSASTESVITTGPLAIQSSVAWPPQTVANQAEGSVPDFSTRNETCLNCHAEILDVKSARPEVSNLHVRHLQSKKIAYKGENRNCLNCHEMWTVAKSAPDKEGWFVMADVYHPNYARSPAGVWKKLIARPGVPPAYGTVDALRTFEPYTYKPTLKRLVCAECHGADSKIKTLYGAPATAN